MPEIICPNCGMVFSVDDKTYASISKQVRDKEFEKELKNQKESAVKLVEAKKDQEITALNAQVNNFQVEKDLAVRQAVDKQLKTLNEKDQLIADLQAQLTSQKQAAEAEKEAAVRLTEAQKDKELTALQGEFNTSEAEKDQIITSLKAQIDSFQTEKELAVRQAVDEQLKALSDKDQLIADLKAKLTNQKQAAEAEKETAIRLAEAQKDKELTALQGQLDSKVNEYALKEANLIADRDRMLQLKDDEIARYKEMKARLSTKMVGESLEQHCKVEFDKIRSIGFPHASFEKDSDSRNGSKGDFIFRDFDANGTEYISIMFEMKNEEDNSTIKHRNEDFFKKLDRDRKEKRCEYAVLVSLLESDNEYYNTGIVDVSHHYEKMYVIRPQFFIPLISLLSNAAKKSLEYRRELAEMRNQNVDVEAFHNQLIDFKERFGRNYELASRRFKEAIDEIDKTISHLQKVRDGLISSENNLRLANNKAEDLTIKKLTRGNQTMTDKFREAGIEIK